MGYEYMRTQTLPCHVMYLAIFGCILPAPGQAVFRLYLLRTNSYGLRGRNGHRHRGSTYGSQRTRSAMPLRVRKAFDVDSKLAQV